MGHSGVNSLTRCNLFCHPRDSQENIMTNSNLLNAEAS